MPKVKLGSMANPSMRITAVVVVTIRYPMLLVSDWTNTMASDMIAWLIPAGRPSRSTPSAYFFFGRKEEAVRPISRRIRMSLTIRMTAESACVRIVARAAPATFMSSPATNQTSSAVFIAAVKSRTRSGKTEMPRPRRIPEMML